MSDRRIFFSCVSSEFHRGAKGAVWGGSYRDTLAAAFREGGWRTVVQEDFSLGGGDLLHKLDQEIERCSHVVHLIGRALGACPCNDEVDTLLARHADFLQNPPRKELFAQLMQIGFRGLSYTQWEAILALHHGVELLVFEMHPDAPRAPDFRPRDADDSLQALHRQRLHGTGKDRDGDVMSVTRVKDRTMTHLLKWYGGHEPVLDQTDAPHPPTVFLPRMSLLSEISTLLAEEPSPSRPRVYRIVRGPSGAGKTALVASVFAAVTGTKSWIDCRVVYNRPSALSVSDQLIVFDNVVERHPVITQNWTSDLKGCRVIILTNEAPLVPILQHQFSLVGDSRAVVLVSPFSAEESSMFIKQNTEAAARENVGLPSNVDWLGGSPLAHQLLASIIARRCTPATEWDALQSMESLKRLQVLIYEWLETCHRDPVATAALEVLSCVPFAGMNASALAEVASIDLTIASAGVEQAMRPLIERGLVTRSKDQFETGEIVYSAHDQVKQAIAAGEAIADDLMLRRSERYLHYLDRRLQSNDSAEQDVLTCVDAWISSWTLLFHKEWMESTHGADFARAMQTHQSLLPKLVERSRNWDAFAPTIERMLQGRISEDVDCARVIAVAHLIGRAPASYVLADTMWKAAHGADGWARASAMATCMSHWNRLGRNAQTRAIGRVKQWLKYAAENARQRKSGWTVDESDPGDDCMVAIAAIHRFCGDVVFEVIDSDEYSRDLIRKPFPIALLLVRLTESGRLASDVGLRSKVKRWVARLDRHDPSVIRVLHCVREHLSNHSPAEVLEQCGLDFEPAQLTRQGTRASDIAAQAASPMLRGYLNTHEDKAFTVHYPSW